MLAASFSNLKDSSLPVTESLGLVSVYSILTAAPSTSPFLSIERLVGPNSNAIPDSAVDSRHRVDEAENVHLIGWACPSSAITAERLPCHLHIM